MAMEKQITFEFKDVAGIYYTCPGCKREWFMGPSELDKFHDDVGNSPVCFPCEADDKKGEVLRERFEKALRNLVGILRLRTAVKDLNVRLILKSPGR